MPLGVLQPYEGISRGAQCWHSLDQNSFNLMSRDSRSHRVKYLSES